MYAVYSDQLGWFGGSMGRQSYGSPMCRVWDMANPVTLSVRIHYGKWDEKKRTAWDRVEAPARIEASENGQDRTYLDLS